MERLGHVGSSHKALRRAFQAEARARETTPCRGRNVWRAGPGRQRDDVLTGPYAAEGWGSRCGRARAELKACDGLVAETLIQTSTGASRAEGVLQCLSPGTGWWHYLQKTHVAWKGRGLAGSGPAEGGMRQWFSARVNPGSGPAQRFLEVLAVTLFPVVSLTRRHGVLNGGCNPDRKNAAPRLPLGKRPGWGRAPWRRGLTWSSRG